MERAIGLVVRVGRPVAIDSHGGLCYDPILECEVESAVIDETLLAILACPVCKAPLRLDGESLVCTRTDVRFPIEDGIPNLLADSAEPPHPEPSPGSEEPGAPPE